MAEPGRDDGDVDTGVQQGHGSAVAQRMRGDLLGLEGWAGRCGSGGVLGDEAFDGVSAEWGAAAGREQRVVRGAAAFGQPGPDRCDGVAGQRRDPVLSSFAVAADVRAAPEVNVADLGAGQFRDAKPGLGGSASNA
jgi:hypothetical protein